MGNQTWKPDQQIVRSGEGVQGPVWQKTSKSRLTIIENSCNPLFYIEYVFAVQG